MIFSYYPSLQSVRWPDGGLPTDELLGGGLRPHVELFRGPIHGGWNPQAHLHHFPNIHCLQVPQGRFYQTVYFLITKFIHIYIYIYIYIYVYIYNIYIYMDKLLYICDPTRDLVTLRRNFE